MAWPGRKPSEKPINGERHVEHENLRQGVPAMRGMAIVLILLGALALGYQGFSYVTRDKVVAIGPLEVTQEKHKTVFLPPVLGAVVLASGIALLLTSSRKV